jgi:hypothetical protein
MKAKAFLVLGFLVVASVVWLLGRPAAPPGIGSAPAGDVTELTVLYSSEKKEWIEAAAAGFAKAHPDIHLALVGKGSFDMAQSILDGRDKPVVWSPADSLVMNLVESEWETRTRARLVDAAGEDAPAPLVVTPLVFAVWDDRAAVLTRNTGGAVSFKTLARALAADGGWASVDGDPRWGFVKLGHTDPTRSNSGLQALFLMSLEYYDRRTLDVPDLLAPKYQEFVRGIERGVTKHEASSGTFMNEMILFGPSKYDIAVVYESLAVAELEHAQGRWGPLRVAYPPITVWSDNPVAVLRGDWVTEAQRRAGRLFIKELRSKGAQEQALRFGFRPADPAVPLLNTDPANPFAKFAGRGVRVDLPPAVDAPSGAVVKTMMTMWQRMMQR